MINKRVLRVEFPQAANIDSVNRSMDYGAVGGGGRKWPFPITLASGLYNSLYYRTSRDISLRCISGQKQLKMMFHEDAAGRMAVVHMLKKVVKEKSTESKRYKCEAF